jgi:hypothetical protein
LRAGIREVRQHLAVLHDAEKILAQMIVLLPECPCQHLKQTIPGRRDLGHIPLRDHVARAVQHQTPPNRNAKILARIEAELAEGVPDLAMRHDARAAPCEWHRRALEDIDFPTPLPQVERAKQPADRAADDRGVARLASHLDSTEIAQEKSHKAG